MKGRREADPVSRTTPAPGSRPPSNAISQQVATLSPPAHQVVTTVRITTLRHDRGGYVVYRGSIEIVDIEVFTHDVTLHRDLYDEVARAEVIRQTSERFAVALRNALGGTGAER